MSIETMSSVAQAAYKILSEAAIRHAPCPSIEKMGGMIGITGPTMRGVITGLERAGLIRTSHPVKSQRVVEIVATGKKTAPSISSAQASLAMAFGWPRITITPEQHSVRLAKAGRFEDEPTAVTDVGWPKLRQQLPPSVMTFSGCGISQVYGCGGQRRGVAGREE